jgi:hypothetical protein
LQLREAEMAKGMKPSDPVERFFKRVSPEPNSGCWLWTGNAIPAGYGQFRVGSMADGSRRYVMAHRFSFEAAKGAIPKGMCLDHLCRMPLCVNPDHLEPVTRGENVRRGLTGNPETNGGARHNRSKTHCPKGHPYNPENTYVNRLGHRSCRACQRAAQLRYQQGKKQ